MKAISIAIASLVIAGCATSGYQSSGYQRFYQSYGDVSQLKEVSFLPEGQEPQLFQVNVKEVENAVRALRAKDYVPIGYSSFNGMYEDVGNAKAQAKRLKAVALIVGAEYTETQTSTVPLSVPTVQSTYGSGTASAGSTYGTYGGTSTTYGSTVVPVTTQQRRYDQGAVYFVKGTRKYRFGIQLNELTPELRKALGRNTGAVADVIVENTPAFFANVLDGDILIAVDGIEVRNVEEASKALGNVPVDAKTSVLNVLRAGVEKKIEVKF